MFLLKFETIISSSSSDYDDPISINSHTVAFLLIKNGSDSILIASVKVKVGLNFGAILNENVYF